jgi:hypothetical protein
MGAILGDAAPTAIAKDADALQMIEGPAIDNRSISPSDSSILPLYSL